MPSAGGGLRSAGAAAARVEQLRRRRRPQVACRAMADCPNCGAQVDEGERLCPNCGFDTGESQAEDVRALREEGKIHPGRLNPDEQGNARAGDPRETQGGL